LINLIYAGLCHNYHIKVTDYILIEAETLPGLAFDPVAPNCGFDMLAGDRQTQARVIELIAFGQQGKKSAAGFAGISKDVLKLC
jgi:hypothetical protein